MGGFIDVHCRVCGYEQTDLGYGHGKKRWPQLVLFHCANCRTIGSQWVHEGESASCAHCYHESVDVLDAASPTLECPRCSEPLTLERREADWE